MSPPLLGVAGRVVFSCHPSLCVCVCACVYVCVCASIVSMISTVRIDELLPQTFVSSASWDKDELIMVWGQKVKGHGHRAETYRGQFPTIYSYGLLRCDH